MTWLAAADEILLAAAWVVLPGMVVGWALGLRGAWPLLAAPPVSLGVLSLWPVVLPFVGIPWNRASAALCVLVTAGLAMVVGRISRRHGSGDEKTGLGGSTWWALAGVVVAGGLGALGAVRGMGAPNLPAQTWDTVFHLNAVRLAIDTGDASSLHLGGIVNPGVGRGFYPGAWHSLTMLSATDSIVVASNAVTLVTLGIVWPLALVAAVRALFPTWPWLGLTVPVAGTAFVVFPAGMLTVGVLWPNALGYALVWPAVALTFLGARRICDAAHSHGHWAPYLAALALAGPGIALSQPNAALVYALLVTPLLVPELVRIGRSLAGRNRLWPVAFAVVWVAVWAAGFLLSVWHIPIWERDATDTFLRGVAWAVGDGQLGTPDWSAVLAALTLVGVVAAAVRRRWSLLVAYSLVLLLGALGVAQVGLNILRPWYGEQLRLLAATALVGAVLVGVGIAAPAAVLGSLVRRPRWRPVVASTIVVVVTAAVILGTGTLRERGRAGTFYWHHQAALERSDFLLQTDELTMVERLGDELPDDALVLGSPFNGSVLLPAVADVDVVYPHFRGTWLVDAVFLARHFREIATDPEVCAAVDRLGVTHLYVDESLFWPDNITHTLYAGLPEYAPPGDFALVDSGGTARVYRIEECG